MPYELARHVINNAGRKIKVGKVVVYMILLDGVEVGSWVPETGSARVGTFMYGGVLTEEMLTNLLNEIL